MQGSKTRPISVHKQPLQWRSAELASVTQDWQYCERNIHMCQDGCSGLGRQPCSDKQWAAAIDCSEQSPNVSYTVHSIVFSCMRHRIMAQNMDGRRQYCSERLPRVVWIDLRVVLSCIQPRVTTGKHSNEVVRLPLATQRSCTGTCSQVAEAEFRGPVWYMCSANGSHLATLLAERCTTLEWQMCS